jgi:broad-specificity NMP kinase
MAIIFITGLSGVGKSTVLETLKGRGYHVVDTDYGYIKEIINNDYRNVIWDQDKIKALIESCQDSHLFISGCYENQGMFYHYFDQIVLLTTDLEVMLERVSLRCNNPYGKKIEEKNAIIDNYHTILPLLKMRASRVIDTTNQTTENVCTQLIRLL